MNNVRLVTNISFTLGGLLLFLTVVWWFGDFGGTGLLHDMFNSIQTILESGHVTTEEYYLPLLTINSAVAIWGMYLAIKQKELLSRAICAFACALTLWIPVIVTILVFSSWN